jgi:hypothetical protein
MTRLNAMEYLCHKWPRICSPVVNTSLSFPHSWFITGFLTRLTRRRVPLMEQELSILPEHLSSYPVLSGVRISPSSTLIKQYQLCLCNTSHVYILINLFDLCQHFFSHCYIHFFKCWHMLNDKGNVSFCHHLASVVCYPSYVITV